MTGFGRTDTHRLEVRLGFFALLSIFQHLVLGKLLLQLYLQAFNLVVPVHIVSQTLGSCLSFSHTHTHTHTHTPLKVHRQGNVWSNTGNNYTLGNRPS